MSVRATALALVFAGLVWASPGSAFELPVQKLELVDNLRQTAERGDGERFARYLGLLKGETSAVEQTFHVSIPAAPQGGALPEVAGALIAGWAFLMTDTLAASPDAPETAWRVVSLLLLKDKEWMLQADPKLFNQFQRSVSELRVLSDESARAAIRADLQKRVGELVAKSLKSQ